MAYRGIVRDGVVVLEGSRPADGTVVEVTPVQSTLQSQSGMPGFGIWRTRVDMPDSGQAAEELRRKSEQRESHG